MQTRKLQEKRKGDITWPENLEEHLSRIDTGPLPEMYNAIWFSISASTSTNYTGTQNHRTSKLQRNFFLGSGWEELFTRQGTPKQILLGMVLHKITDMNNLCFTLPPALLYWERSKMFYGESYFIFMLFVHYI